MIEKIKYYLYLYSKQILIVTGFISLLVIFFITTIIFKKDDVSAINKSDLVENALEKEETVEKYFYVDIKGEVIKPGVYRLKENSIVNDVIKLAGGLTKNSSTEYINLSLKIKDEMVIIIYNKNDIKSILNKKKEDEYVKVNIIKNSEIKNDALIDPPIIEEESKLVSINNGSLAELTNINGLGEKKALAIIEYRKINGNFEKLEDILNVSGIGESTLDKIKDKICL